ncbi:MAG: hypothetical protein IJR94_05775 [Synergistaceae bacterium]|nr:hypothetical protein [Synergistaceae bacterium]
MANMKFYLDIEGAKLRTLDDLRENFCSNDALAHYTHVLAGTDSEGNLIGQLEFIALSNDEQLKKLHGYQDYIVIDS